MLRMSYSDHFLSIIRQSVCPVVRLLILSNNNSSKAIEATCPLLGKNVA